jgi:hypothetical protein
VLVEQIGKIFPAQVALPAALVEWSQLDGPLPEALRQAGEAELVAAGIPWAVEAAANQQFAELSAANAWSYHLKEVAARPDRLIVKFSAALEPGAADYVTILKTLAVIATTRIELFLVSENALPARPPAGAKIAGWVNGLLKPPDPAVMAGATVGEPLLAESEIYRPGQRLNARAGQQVPQSEAEKPAAVYDPALGKTWLNGVELAP